ncbi:hypothetical protein [Streptomyces sp. ME19-01-6]|uniref:hypothetical protein n=1 Tax=Streptomyces sp. ME19-01-6 TaxID=3028686 RepID=UPI0029A5475A|nr:hypothetical protein [Streptomyces sp. ME19-01-6]MDX3228198.1 hypothetical protein [Streptomyces sp. ME19-01-6]
MNGEAAGVVGAGGTFLLLIVVVWQIAVTWRARMLSAREEQYKQLAMKYAQLMEDNLELHRRSLDELTHARLSIEALEKRTHAIE